MRYFGQSPNDDEHVIVYIYSQYKSTDIMYNCMVTYLF